MHLYYHTTNIEFKLDITSPSVIRYYTATLLSFKSFSNESRLHGQRLSDYFTDSFVHGAILSDDGGGAAAELVAVEVELGLLCLKGGVGEHEGKSEEPSSRRERLLCRLGGLGALDLGGKGGVRLHLQAK